jgi:WD40 repeat protein
VARPGHGDMTARLWDADTGKRKAAFKATKEGLSAPRFSAAVSPDGRLVAVPGEEEPVALWDVASRKELVSLPSKSNNLKPCRWPSARMEVARRGFPAGL